MDPVVVTLPHRQGKAEATRRIKAGIEALRARYTAQLKIAEENWEGDRLRFRALVGQGAADFEQAQLRRRPTAKPGDDVAGRKARLGRG